MKFEHCEIHNEILQINKAKIKTTKKLPKNYRLFLSMTANLKFKLIQYNGKF